MDIVEKVNRLVLWMDVLSRALLRAAVLVFPAKDTKSQVLIHVLEAG